MPSSDPRIADFLSRNKQHAQSPTTIPTLESEAHLPPSPAVIIISCFDVRIQPRDFLQITDPTEAFFLSNAGGRVDADTLRSLTVLDNVKGIKSVMLIHHTDCGLTHATDASLKEKLRNRLPEREKEIERLGPLGEIKDMDQSVRDDVAAIKASPFLEHIDVRGYVFDIKSGSVSEVQ